VIERMEIAVSRELVKAPSHFISQQGRKGKVEQLLNSSVVGRKSWRRTRRSCSSTCCSPRKAKTASIQLLKTLVSGGLRRWLIALAFGKKKLLQYRLPTGLASCEI